MTRIADISIGETKYDAPFKEILDASGVEKDEFEGLEYFTWLPFFVIAGASVTPKIRVHGDHTHFEGATIEVPDAEIDLFYQALPHLLQQVIDINGGGDGDGDDHEGHDHEGHDHEGHSH